MIPTKICYTITGLMAITILNGVFNVETANILIIHPIFTTSHHFDLITIGEDLANRGHNVTLVRFKGRFMMPTKLIHPVFLEVQIPDNQKTPFITEDGKIQVSGEHSWNDKVLVQNQFLNSLLKGTLTSCKTLLSEKTLNSFRNGPKYDVAIVDLATNACGLAFAHELGIPVVGYWALFQNCGEMFWTNTIMNPAIIPLFTTGYTDRMTFIQRCINTYFYFLGTAVGRFMFAMPLQDIISEHLPNMPGIPELIQNMSMLFVLPDFTFDFPRPLFPNTVHLGCVMCRPAKSLSQDLEDFMKSSGNDGVIIFSLGFGFNDSSMPITVVKEIYEAFSRCKQKFIAKLPKHIPGVNVPPNVHAVEWMPQQDILGHPKTRLFITHCGLHGVLEALYHGVPMVGIPIAGDQIDALARIESKGAGVGLHKHNLSADNLYNTIQAVLNNKRYYENAKMISTLMRDQPQSAMEKATYWIEYVIRHHGAPHLRSSDHFLNLAQYLLLDVVAFFAFIFVIFLIICRWLMKKILSMSKLILPQTCNNQKYFVKSKKE